MKQCLFLATIFIFSFSCFSQSISGLVSGADKQPLSYASIIIKGTTKGTSANSAGFYNIDLDPGTYTLVAQHVGNKSIEKKVVLGKENIIVNFELPEQQYDLGNVIVKQGEDPAYEIIRQAIKKRSVYENEVKKFTTEVYIKGQLKLRNYPKRVLGEKVDFEDGDTSKRKMFFLSETIAKYSVDEPKRKVEVLSTKVSGQSDGFGFSNPQIFSFYENNIRLGNLNPRGFISPIAEGALNYYRYKFEGTFFENNKMISRIKVIPKRNYEPLFNGYINIIEDEWRIHSVQLTLYKENQMQFVDTLVIEQIYVPIGRAWVVKQQTITPSLKILGFDVYGGFVQVYDNYNLNPVFPKKFFDNTVLKFYDSANKKPLVYWDSIRPIPLLAEEEKDYIKKDSLEQLRKDPAYLDSLDRRRNRPSFMGVVLTGYTYSNSKKRKSVSFEQLINTVSFNTMEGVVVNLNPTFRKRFSETGRSRIAITPTLRYGFSNQRFNSKLNVSYVYGKKYLSTLSITGGRELIQYNSNNPVGVFGNTTGTLLFENNFLKLYEAGVARINYSKGIGDGLTISGQFEYEDRIPIVNTTDFTFFKVKDRVMTPNLTIAANVATSIRFNVQWRPGSRYIEFPDRKVSIGSKWPVFNATLTKGIPNLFGSDADYLKWRLTVNDNLNLKLLGRLSYRFATGGFVQKQNVSFQDYTHYYGNQSSGASPYIRSFQNMPLYAYSNTEKAYGEAHVEYHLNGFLTNKIPLFKKLNWFLVAGANYLHVNKNMKYGEVLFGIENIFKIIRIDYVQTFTGNGFRGHGIRYSVRGLMN